MWWMVVMRVHADLLPIPQLPEEYCTIALQHFLSNLSFIALGLSLLQLINL